MQSLRSLCSGGGGWAAGIVSVFTLFKIRQGWGVSIKFTVSLAIRFPQKPKFLRYLLSIRGRGSKCTQSSFLNVVGLLQRPHSLPPPPFLGCHFI